MTTIAKWARVEVLPKVPSVNSSGVWVFYTTASDAQRMKDAVDNSTRIWITAVDIVDHADYEVFFDGDNVSVMTVMFYNCDLRDIFNDLDEGK